jgi:hypothetical protein
MDDLKSNTSTAPSDGDLTIDLTTTDEGRASQEPTVTGAPAAGALVDGGTPRSDGNVLTVSNVEPRLVLKPYLPDQQRDYVRLIVTVGLLLMLAGVVVWSCIETASWSNHWAQTKEMLQTILPALTGLIGSVIGFYFGSGVNSTNSSSVKGNTNQ